MIEFGYPTYEKKNEILFVVEFGYPRYDNMDAQIYIAPVKFIFIILI